MNIPQALTPENSVHKKRHPKKKRKKVPETEPPLLPQVQHPQNLEEELLNQMTNHSLIESMSPEERE